MYPAPEGSQRRHRNRSAATWTRNQVTIITRRCLLPAVFCGHTCTVVIPATHATPRDPENSFLSAVRHLLGCDTENEDVDSLREQGEAAGATTGKSEEAAKKWDTKSNKRRGSRRNTRRDCRGGNTPGSSSTRSRNRRGSNKNKRRGSRRNKNRGSRSHNGPQYQLS